MNSLSEDNKKRILNLLEKISTQIHEERAKDIIKEDSPGLHQLEKYRLLLNKYRRFISPRKVIGPVIDKVKNKFYYETEHFVGDVFANQEQFNAHVIDYLEELEKEIKKLKKQISSLKKK